MAHLAQANYFQRVKARYPHMFHGVSVLDVGSLDINGNNRWLFIDYDYIGVDVGPGPNVDVVTPIHLYKTDNVFNTVISSECFEHDKYFELSLNRCVELTRPGGLFTFTCAGECRGEHGTERTDGGYSSPNTYKMWDNYYRNLSEQDVKDAIDLAEFLEYELIYDENHCDLYFMGIKDECQ